MDFDTSDAENGDEPDVWQNTLKCDAQSSTQGEDDDLKLKLCPHTDILLDASCISEAREFLQCAKALSQGHSLLPKGVLSGELGKRLLQQIKTTCHEAKNLLEQSGGSCAECLRRITTVANEVNKL